MFDINTLVNDAITKIVDERLASLKARVDTLEEQVDRVDNQDFEDLIKEALRDFDMSDVLDDYFNNQQFTIKRA